MHRLRVFCYAGAMNLPHDETLVTRAARRPTLAARLRLPDPRFAAAYGWVGGLFTGALVTALLWPAAPSAPLESSASSVSAPAREAASQSAAAPAGEAAPSSDDAPASPPSVRDLAAGLQPVKAPDFAPAVAPLAPASRVAPTPHARTASPAAASASTPTPRPPAAAAASSSGTTLSVSAVGRSAAAGPADARVYVDGALAGPTPLQGFAVAAGTHRLRVDCLYKGKTYPGRESTVALEPNVDVQLEHTCDVWVLIGGPGTGE